MIKLSVAFGMKPGISPREFRVHYEVRHAALVDAVTVFGRHVKGYVQNYGVAPTAEIRRPAAPLAGCSELRFKSVDALLAAYAEPEYQRLREDEMRFVDFDNLALSIAEETVAYREAARPRAKLLRFLRRRPGVDQAAFRRFRDAFRAALIESRPVRGFATAYVQCHSVVGDRNPFPTAEVVDGIDEYWLYAPADAGALLDGEMALAMRLNAGRYIDRDRSVDLVAESRIVPGYGADPASGTNS